MRPPSFNRHSKLWADSFKAPLDMRGYLVPDIISHLKQQLIMNLENRVADRARSKWVPIVQHLHLHQVILHGCHRELNRALCSALVGEVANLSEGSGDYPRVD